MDNEAAIIEYANELSRIQNNLENKIVIIVRTYTSKPRSFSGNYKGLIHQPNLYKPDNMIWGIEKMRRIHTRIVNETNMLIADELLYTELYPYIDDTVTYFAIGAKSVED